MRKESQNLEGASRSPLKGQLNMGTSGSPSIFPAKDCVWAAPEDCKGSGKAGVCPGLGGTSLKNQHQTPRTSGSEGCCS